MEPLFCLYCTVIMWDLNIGAIDIPISQINIWLASSSLECPPRHRRPEYDSCLRGLFYRLEITVVKSLRSGDPYEYIHVVLFGYKQLQAYPGGPTFRLSLLAECMSAIHTACIVWVEWDERFNQTISTIWLAALLRRCELPLLEECWTNSVSPGRPSISIITLISEVGNVMFTRCCSRTAKQSILNNTMDYSFSWIHDILLKLHYFILQVYSWNYYSYWHPIRNSTVEPPALFRNTLLHLWRRCYQIQWHAFPYTVDHD